MRRPANLRSVVLFRRDLDLLLYVLFGAGILLWLFLQVDVDAARSYQNLPYWRLSLYQIVSHLGYSGVVLYPTGIAVIVLLLIRRAHISKMVDAIAAALTVRFGLVFLAVAVPGLLVAIIKRLIGRARPLYLEQLGHLAFTPFSKSSYFASFPSGHATTAFAFAMVAGALWPAARIPLFAFAALLAATRVMIGVHYPSDVFMGVVVGSIGAFLVVRLFALYRRVFAVTADGSVRPMPGPSRKRLIAFGKAVYGAIRTPGRSQSA